MTGNGTRQQGPDNRDLAVDLYRLSNLIGRVSLDSIATVATGHRSLSPIKAGKRVEGSKMVEITDLPPPNCPITLLIGQFKKADNLSKQGCLTEIRGR